MSAIERLVEHIQSRHLGESVMPKHRSPTHGRVFAFSKCVVDDDDVYTMKRKPFVCKSSSESIALRKAKKYAREQIGLFTAKKRGFMVNMKTSTGGNDYEYQGLGVFGSEAEADVAGKKEIEDEMNRYFYGIYDSGRFGAGELGELYMNYNDEENLVETMGKMEEFNELDECDKYSRLDAIAFDMFSPDHEETDVDFDVVEVEIRD